MIENEEIKEQPEVTNSQEVAEDSLENQAEVAEEASGEAEKGVPVGKFKSVDDLYNAYNNLQAEFTRKSQRLAELEKEKTSNQTPDRESCLKSFLSKNQQAVAYAQELDRRVGEQAASEELYEKAWANLIYEKLSAKDISKEPLVQDIVLKDDKIQEMIIKKYVEEIQQQKTPIVIQSGQGERVVTNNSSKVTTFADAKKKVFDLISQN